MIAVLLLIGLTAAGLGVGLIVTALAPVGYQDEHGFHFGQTDGAHSEEVFCGVPQPRPI
jgi:hypothetical protein